MGCGFTLASISQTSGSNEKEIKLRREPSLESLTELVHVTESPDFALLAGRRVNRLFGFDLLVARADSEEYRRYLGFFQQVRLEPDRKKGILKIWLR